MKCCEKTIICLVRHGRTFWNSQGLIQGLTDNPLDDVGRLQAQECAKFLKSYDPHWDVILSSPLTRAKETGEIIAKYLDYNMEIILDYSFREREFGSLEGEKLTKEMYQTIFEENALGLEKIKDLQTRAINALLSLAKRFPGKKILVTTHSQFIKGVLSYLDRDFDFMKLLKNSSLNYFEVTNNEIKIIKYNITAEN